MATWFFEGAVIVVLIFIASALYDIKDNLADLRNKIEEHGPGVVPDLTEIETALDRIGDLLEGNWGS
jgi:hypothetical protein